MYNKVRCGDNKKLNGTGRDDKVLLCHGWNLKFHLSFHLNCPGKKKEDAKNTGILD